MYCCLRIHFGNYWCNYTITFSVCTHNQQIDKKSCIQLIFYRNIEAKLYSLIPDEAGIFNGLHKKVEFLTHQFCLLPNSLHLYIKSPASLQTVDLSQQHSRTKSCHQVYGCAVTKITDQLLYQANRMVKIAYCEWSCCKGYHYGQQWYAAPDNLLTINVAGL